MQSECEKVKQRDYGQRKRKGGELDSMKKEAIGNRSPLSVRVCMCVRKGIWRGPGVGAPLMSQR